MSPETQGFRHFHDQLQTLKERLLDMSARAEELVDLAVDSLLTRDKEKADAVIGGDRELDMMELECEQLAVSLLALQRAELADVFLLVRAAHEDAGVVRRERQRADGAVELLELRLVDVQAAHGAK